MELNKKSWNIIMNKLKEYDLTLHSLVKDAKVTKYDGQTLYLWYENDKVIHNKIVNKRIQEITDIANGILSPAVEFNFRRKGEDVEKLIEFFDGELISTDNSVL